MLSIGARVCKWTTLLLLCSIPTPAQPTNGTTTAAESHSHSHAAVASSRSTTNLHSPVALSSMKPAASSYADSDSTCLFRTINYITHTLPQQCLKTAWSAPTKVATLESIAGGEASPGPSVAISSIGEGGPDVRTGTKTLEEPVASKAPGAHESGSSDAPTSSSSQSEPEAEAETDSPLDNANFLSFEDWKKKNLVRVGQSPENVGQGRAASSEDRARRRPVNVNALDSLGEESEIEIDFGGFGNPSEETGKAAKPPSGTEDAVEATKAAEDEDNVAPSSWALSKDAGKTCKERFNYASFDCAATVLKTNSKVKGSSAILVENKDSYLLNECSAQNKFIIVELCDDILVDTIVLANYEFFSSMFRHFRVSVSDRYPVKMDRWRILDTFEARNSREVQPFLVKAPQIWARYLRIEFLTHYGNEFYCPISLLRVHGTTMMEQFRREEEEARGDDDYAQPIEAADGEPVMTASGVIEDGGYVPTEQVPMEADKEVVGEDSTTANITSQQAEPTQADGQPTNAEQQQQETEPTPSESTAAQLPSGSNVTEKGAVKGSERSTSISSPLAAQNASDGGESAVTSAQESKSSSSLSASNSTKGVPGLQSSSEDNPATVIVSSEQVGNVSAKVSMNETANAPSTPSSTKATSNTTAHSTPTQKESQSRSPSQPQPNTASPTTQESFFKSIHKRLQQLEVNSTLSLQYIEEQSRILRDAFIKVEKRQLSKTEKFLDHLNSTVMHELKSYRSMYDQLWQSTILELEGMKERQKAEMGEIGTRLSLVADELVWQKRMAVVQSTLLLLCLGLVLFVRSGPVGVGPQQGLDVPIVQQLGNKYTRFFDTPPGTPDARSSTGRKRRGFRSMWRSDTSAHLTSDAETDGRRSPVGVEFSPPTPEGEGEGGGNELGNLGSPTANNSIKIDNDGEPDADGDGDVDADQQQRIQVLATQSGPATPRGSRDSRPSWEEVERAVGLLKAEEQGQSLGFGNGKLGRDAQRRKKRSPLRRSESYDYDGTAERADGGVDDSPGEDDAGVEGVGGVSE
ncbi:UNC-like C-terminal-domain-containing protein [Clohesyomyces aquaticus]|uniref:UNC-like C-terminal-domain-containing protein n=1 Tax=Clohesyomyces aquaticus TaxID=1231657 RepID=A0A1Y2A121_9PLEO|nr:UNC-like C-terminal-domain-containing protein [Clohesyomyces aquaticus]